MATRTYKDKNNNEWSWEETPEVIKALKEYEKVKFSGNYEGPLYAPHPNVKDGKETN